MWSKKRNTFAAAIKRMAKEITQKWVEYKFYHTLGKEWRKA